MDKYWEQDKSNWTTFSGLSMGGVNQIWILKNS